MRAEVRSVRVVGPQAVISAAEQAAGDLRRTGRVQQAPVFATRDDVEEISVEAELAPAD